MKGSEEIDLVIHPRSSATVSIEIPVDTMESLKRVALSRDTSIQALVKFYVGQGLRQDLSRLFDERELDSIGQVLAQYAPSQNHAGVVLRESQDDAPD